MAPQNVTLLYKVDEGLKMMCSQLVMLFAEGIAPTMKTKIAR
jgi:hypothetical protein